MRRHFCADVIATGDWIEAGDAAPVLTDYEDADQIQVFYDESGDPPAITVTTAGTTATVNADGVPVLSVPNGGGLEAGDIVLVPRDPGMA